MMWWLGAVWLWLGLGVVVGVRSGAPPTVLFVLVDDWGSYDAAWRQKEVMDSGAS